MKITIRMGFLLAFGSLTYGQSCVQKCMDAWFCPTPGQGNCAEKQMQQRNLCEISCRGKSGEGWGAIVYSVKEDVWGSGIEQSSQPYAARLAVQFCEKNGGTNCVVRTSFFNKCGAIAVDGAIVGAGTGTKAAAQQAAVADCQRLGGKACVVKAAACSGGEGSTTSAIPNAPRPPRAISWAAIAYSNRDMGAGWSQQKDDRASAEKEAMSVCSERGHECTLRATFNKLCGALAADGAFAGVGMDADQRTANQKAIDDCRKNGGARCALHISFCSF